MSIDELVAEVLKLGPQARARLAERLLASLESLSDEENAQLWGEEAERRGRVVGCWGRSRATCSRRVPEREGAAFVNGHFQFHHKEILRAVEQRDAGQAREAMTAHLRQVRDDLHAPVGSRDAADPVTVAQ